MDLPIQQAWHEDLISADVFDDRRADRSGTGPADHGRPGKCSYGDRISAFLPVCEQ